MLTALPRSLAPWIVLFAATAYAQPPAPASIDLESTDGTRLKATYYDPGRPGAAILLLHQCNRDRASWVPLASEAARRGFHVLALDYRGYGESAGERHGTPQEQQAVVVEKWPGDVDAAFAWLAARPGVDRNRIGAAGASCGVNQSVLLASRHPEVKTVILLSGGVTPAGRQHLRQSPALPVLAAASHGDGDVVNTMRWILGWSRNPHNRFVEYEAAGHGTDMFAVEAGLQPLMLDWFDRHLRKDPGHTTPPPAPSTPTAVEEFWDTLTGPAGVARARQIYDRVRQQSPDTVLFPEGELNAHGYVLLQEGKIDDAIEVFRLNVDAFPASANVYDSLSDAYLAAGKDEEALRYAEKALAVLPTDTRITEDFRALIRESAETKVRDLKKKTQAAKSAGGGS